MIKKIILVILVIFVLFSCKKKNEFEDNEAGKETVYTDSFSPPDWENPVSRKLIISGDKDIGVYTKEDTIDPKSRNTFVSVKKFIDSLKTNKSELEKIMTPSLYSSFILRYKDFSFDKEYELRVEQQKDLTLNKFWVKFKIKMIDKSILGKIELEFENNECKIDDFEDSFVNDLSGKQ